MASSDSFTPKHSPRHQNYHPMCFSLKGMTKNTFLQNGGIHNIPANGSCTDR